MSYVKLFSNLASPSLRASSTTCAFRPLHHFVKSTLILPISKGGLRLKCGNPRFQSSSPSSIASGDGSPEKKSLFQRFKAMYKDYWYVLVPVHVVTSLGWIGGFYYTVSSGFDLGYYMKKTGMSESFVDKITKSGAGNLAVAYALYKIATPARYTVTLGGTTMAINSLTKLGYIRPVKEIYSANKQKFQTFQKNLNEKRKAGKGSQDSSS